MSGPQERLRCSHGSAKQRIGEQGVSKGGAGLQQAGESGGEMAPSFCRPNGHGELTAFGRR